jgi:predicted O-methyltransferase YrrM
LPQWYIYKLKNLGFRCDRTLNNTGCGVESGLETKEHFIQTILFQNRSKKFLEIGIGEFPNVKRIKLMQANKIQYTACDFEVVCSNHKRELAIRGIDAQSIKFASNKVGTYCWTLFEMLKNKEQFDIIYLDGHHTFYVDLPAVFLAHYILIPGGYFLVDDIQWTCNFLKNNMLRSFTEWHFYHRMYNLAEYEIEQQSMPHIKMIAEQILLGKLGYSKIEKYSTPFWWTLQKPISAEL